MLRRWLMVVPILCFIGSAPAHAGRADPLFTPEPIEIPAGKSADEVKTRYAARYCNVIGA